MFDGIRAGVAAVAQVLRVPLMVAAGVAVWKAAVTTGPKRLEWLGLSILFAVLAR